MKKTTSKNKVSKVVKAKPKNKVGIKPYSNKSRKKKLPLKKEILQRAVIQPIEKLTFARKVRKYFFEPRFHFSRIQFNLVAFVLITSGLIAGTYLAATKLIQIFAANDTITTWTYDSASASSFTYNPGLITVNDTGAYPGINKILNGTLDSNTANWSGTQGYLLNDQFDDTLPSGMINNTVAVSGLGTRKVNSTDGTQKILNWNFETAPYSPHASWGEAAGSGSIADTSVAHTGSHAVALTAGSPTNTQIYQFITVVPNKSYTLTFWARGDGINQGSYDVRDETNQVYISSTPTTGVAGTTYQKVTYTFTAPATCTSVTVRLRSNTNVAGSTVYYDDVSVALSAGTISIDSGKLFLNGGVSTPTWSDPGLWYGITPRVLGKVFMGSFNYTSGTWQISYDDDAAAIGVGGGFYMTGNTMVSYVDSGSAKTITTLVPGTDYRFAIVLRNQGYWIFIKGGIYTQWTLVEVSTKLSTANMYPTVSNNSGIASVMDLRIPETTFTASPLAYDTFSRTESSTLSQSETTSSDAQAVTARTWVNDSNVGVLTSQKLANPSFEKAGAGGTDAFANWVEVPRTGSVTRDFSTYHSGNYSVRLTAVSNTSEVNSPAMTVVPGRTYDFSFWTRGDGTNGGSYYVWNRINSSYITTQTSTGVVGTDWTKVTTNFTAPANCTSINIVLISPSVAGSAWFDDIIVVSSLDGYATINPTTSTEYVTNGDFESWASATDANNFTEVGTGSSTVNRETSNVHSGFRSLRFDVDSLNSGIYVEQSLAIPIGTWMKQSVWFSSPTGGSAAFPGGGGGATAGQFVLPITSEFSQSVSTSRITASNPIRGLKRWVANSSSIFFDDYSVKALIPSSLFSSVDVGTSDVLVEANVTLNAGTQAGLVLNLDNPSNPQNFVIAYHDGTNLHLDKSVAGTYTSLLDTPVTYVAGATIAVRKEGTSYKLYYNNGYAASLTVSDVSILGGTKHGLFSTYNENTFDNFIVWASGVNGEYSNIPFDDLTVSTDTNTKHTGASSAKLVSGGNDANFIQSINVGNTSQYIVQAYAKIDNSTAVDSSTLALYYDGNTISTNYTFVGSGWYRLSGIITGANASKNVGVRVKGSKTVYLDDFNLIESGTYSIFNTTAYQNSKVITWDTFCQGVLSGSTCTPDAIIPAGSNIKYQLCTDDGNLCESSGLWKYWDGDSLEPAVDTVNTVNTASEITQDAMNALSVSSKKLSVKSVFTYDGSAVPILKNLSIGLTTDSVEPDVNASATELLRSNSGLPIEESTWMNVSTPFFRWRPGADDSGGVGLMGYCLYLGKESTETPEQSKGLLGTSPVAIANTPCAFIVPESVDANGYVNFDLSNVAFHGANWLTTSEDVTDAYYLNIKPIDRAGNVYSGGSETFEFFYDETLPTNVKSISTPGSVFSNIIELNFNWAVSGSNMASDSNSLVLGYQYQINGTDPSSWRGTSHSSVLNIDYIPYATSEYFLSVAQDGTSVSVGDNTVYFRVVDNAGNYSSPDTYRTANLAYGGAAPAFAENSVVTVTPDTSVENQFSLSWPTANAATGKTIQGYYYMVNTTPPANAVTLLANASMYIPVGLNTTIVTTSLHNVIKGGNTVYVVAVDNEGNYSSSSKIAGTFTLNSTNPDPVQNLRVSDTSIKESQLWSATIAWSEPEYKGTGTLTYVIQRSENTTLWAEIGRTTGNSYLDIVPESKTYYWRVGTVDTSDLSNSNPSFTNGLSLLPKGKYISAANLVSGPEITEISTRRAAIKWITGRESDSRVVYGLEVGKYFDEEIGNSDQTTSHEVRILNLEPGTRYYYKVMWTDEDGNTSQSDERSFITNPAPQVLDVQVTDKGLYSSTITYRVKGTSRVRINYGKTTLYGAELLTNTSAEDSIYNVKLVDLSENTTYHYSIGLMDSDGNWFSTLSDQVFSTLPLPRVTNVRIQGAKNTLTSTVQLSWFTNVETSSIITYFPENQSVKSTSKVDLKSIVGEHKMIIDGLMPETNYLITITAKDRNGNEGNSEVQRFTTAIDTRPPAISNLTVDGEISSSMSNINNDSGVQLVVSWSTDEPATSQVEFAEGAGTTYTNKTFEDGALTMDHFVILPNLTSSKVYHLRVISKDKAGNETVSYDVVAVTPKAGESAFDLIMNSLKNVFSR